MRLLVVWLFVCLVGWLCVYVCVYGLAGVAWWIALVVGWLVGCLGSVWSRSLDKDGKNVWTDGLFVCLFMSWGLVCDPWLIFELIFFN